MKLEIRYLRERHEFWKSEIGKLGIWDPTQFKEILIQIRPKSKSYNGLFSRRWLLKGGKRVLVDRIFIYNNSPDYEPSFIDSVLVHEMIHQYIFQNKIKDSSTHGKVFKSFMNAINAKFAGKLRINVTDHNPSLPQKGAGKIIHRLLFSLTDKDFYCCVIHPRKIKEFSNMVKNFEKSGTVKSHFWAVSNDIYFEGYARCTRVLHGVKKPKDELKAFCQEYRVLTIEEWV